MASTDYYNQPPNIAAPPNPQIGVGPDDVLTIVNRTIARYPNPNAAGNTPVANPYNNPPTSKAWLDTWMGIANLALVCPTVPRSNSTCVIDNASIRYDQMQGRFVVLFTATDVPSHISNFVLVVSRYATFNCSVTGTPPPATQPCPNTSDLFTPPIVPIVGGPSTGGVNTYWTMSLIPVNVVLPGTITAGTQFCAGGGIPTSAPAPTAGVFTAGPILTGCTNYFPTGARFGLDNDNIILTAPVLDVSLETGPTALNPTCTNTATFGCGPVLPGGPFAGTRVVTVPKVVVYNGVAIGANPTNIGGTGTGLVNLSDDTLTGTLTAQTNTALSPSITETCTPQPGTPIPCIFWEPDNLRGRALASFTAQVGPTGSLVAGVLTPIDYLVGRPITNSLGGFDNYPGIWVQPVIFTCPTGAIFPAPAGVTFCGIASGPANPGGGQVAEAARLGVRIDPPPGAPQPPQTVFQLPRLINTIATTADPAAVGQGKSDTAVSLANDGTKVGRLFVGDQRPQQVIFREGLLYMASAVRLFDNIGTAVGSQTFGTSTVMYNIIKQGGPSCLNPALNGDNLPADTSGIGFCSTAGGSNPYSPFGTRIGNPAQVLETYWYNGQQVPDPTGNPTGYGFYAPMFDTPANVVNGSSLPNSSGISPINLFPWLEKLFVGDTVGGPATINNTFATHFPSLWDYRPGDDAFDTTLPYLNPITGTLVTSDPRLCLAPVTASAFATTVATNNANRTLSNLSPSVAGLPLEVGMTVTGPGLPVAPAVLATIASFSATANTVTLSIGVVTPGSAGTTPGGLAPGGYTFSASATATCPMIPFGTRGGASTDPNDGSLWLYGAFGKNRLSSVIGPGQWGTSVANYQLDFPATDSYGNDNAYFADVPTTNPFFTWIQIAKNTGIFPTGSGAGTCPTSAQTNPPILPPPGSTAGGTTVPGASIVCTNFGPDTFVTRAEMALWVVRAQMDENQVLTYLRATGGIPTADGLAATSFADLNAMPTVPSATGQQLINYIEVMYRRGYTKGCGTTSDARRKYCPSDLLTRGQMAVFLIRAKMSNVFPTSLSGIPLAVNAGPAGGSVGAGSAYGDNFGFFTPAQSYFTDLGTVPDFYIYIQKMRELRITNGTATTLYAPDANLTRAQIATFIVRAFFL